MQKNMDHASQEAWTTRAPSDARSSSARSAERAPTQRYGPVPLSMLTTKYELSLSPISSLVYLSALPSSTFEGASGFFNRWHLVSVQRKSICPISSCTKTLLRPIRYLFGSITPPRLRNRQRMEGDHSIHAPAFEKAYSSLGFRRSSRSQKHGTTNQLGSPAMPFSFNQSTSSSSRSLEKRYSNNRCARIPLSPYQAGIADSQTGQSRSHRSSFRKYFGAKPSSNTTQNDCSRIYSKHEFLPILPTSSRSTFTSNNQFDGSHGKSDSRYAASC